MIACAIISHFWLFFSLSLSFLFFYFLSKHFPKALIQAGKGKNKKGGEEEEKEEQEKTIGPPSQNIYSCGSTHGPQQRAQNGLYQRVITPSHRAKLPNFALSGWQLDKGLILYQSIPSSQPQNISICVTNLPPCTGPP